ncbi:HTH domain-containing protein [Fulvivirga sp. M361]|uniref:HTH domain-containing protein n=1 Tax=Fulvivirga sp. M361 TaxID=2594266 RepID=UPI00162A9F8B|nr:HTH domain-containing protein [Fulvivirga sp. M361]
MALDKIIQRYIELDQLITNQESGNADDLAKALGISKRQVYNYFHAMHKIGINIKFNPAKQTYTYPEKD